VWIALRGRFENFFQGWLVIRMKFIILDYKLFVSEICEILESWGWEYRKFKHQSEPLESWLNEAKDFEADIMFSIGFSHVALRLAQLLNVPYVAWNIDPVSQTRLNFEVSPGGVPCFVFVHDRELVESYQSRGVRHVEYLPLAAHSQWREQDCESKRTWDVSFVGNSLEEDLWREHPMFTHQENQDATALEFEGHIHRTDFQGLSNSKADEFLAHLDPQLSGSTGAGEALAGYLSHLLRIRTVQALSAFKLAVWGDKGWQLLGDSYRGVADRRLELNQIYRQSAVNLDIPRIYQRQIITMRVFDILAVGGILLTEENPALDEFFVRGQHLFTYRGVEELREKTQWILEHYEEAKEVAENGRKLVLAEHTIERRLLTILKTIRSEISAVPETLPG